MGFMNRFKEFWVQGVVYSIYHAVVGAIIFFIYLALLFKMGQLGLLLVFLLSFGLMPAVNGWAIEKIAKHFE